MTRYEWSVDQDEVRNERPDAAAYFEGAVFPRDTGTLDPRSRELLIQLLRSRHIDGVKDEKLWADLLDREDLMRSRLHDMYLDLVIDTERKVAFKRQVEADEIEGVPSLLRDSGRRMSVLASLLLCWLRLEYDRQEQQGVEYPHCDRTEMLDYLGSFRPERERNKTGFAAACEKAVQDMENRRILIRTRDPERVRISGVIAPLFTVDKVTELIAAYTHRLGGDDVTDPGEAGTAAGEAEEQADD